VDILIPVGRRAGRFVFHNTRNTAATNLRAGGMDEADAMKITGHTTSHVFRHYHRRRERPQGATRPRAAAEAFAASPRLREPDPWRGMIFLHSRCTAGACL